MNSSVLKLWIFVFVTTAIAYGSYKGYQVMKKNGSYKGYQVMKKNRLDKEAIKTAKDAVLDPDAIVLDELKDITLLDQYDNVFHFDDLKGKIWVVNMFYADCPGPCKAIMHQVERLQNNPELKKAQFLSITSNPVADNTNKLLTYSKDFHVQKGQWHFLNGTQKITTELSQIIFFDFSGDFNKHRKRIYLFSQQGKIFGSYLYENPLEMNKLRQDIIKLSKKESPKEDNKPNRSNKRPVAPEQTGGSE